MHPFTRNMYFSRIFHPCPRLTDGRVRLVAIVHAMRNSRTNVPFILLLRNNVRMVVWEMKPSKWSWYVTIVQLIFHWPGYRTVSMYPSYIMAVVIVRKRVSHIRERSRISWWFWYMGHIPRVRHTRTITQHLPMVALPVGIGSPADSQRTLLMDEASTSNKIYWTMTQMKIIQMTYKWNEVHQGSMGTWP